MPAGLTHTWEGRTHVHIHASVVDDGALIGKRPAPAAKQARVVNGAGRERAAACAVRDSVIVDEVAPPVQPHLAHDVPRLLQQQQQQQRGSYRKGSRQKPRWSINT